MFLRQNKAVLIIFLTALSLGIFYYFSFQNETRCGEYNKCFSKTAVIRVAGVEISAQVAASDEERVRGLSGRESIGDAEGMLFIFEREGLWGFWMKGMKFPIDIAWISADKKIVHIENRVSPQSYPKSYYPVSPSLYVLESRAGFFEDKNIKMGDLVEIKF